MATSALRLGWLAGSYSTQPGRTPAAVSRLLIETRYVVAERLHCRRGIVTAGIGEQNNKLIASLHGEDIGFTEGAFHQIGDGDQRAIALFMPRYR